MPAAGGFPAPTLVNFEECKLDDPFVDSHDGVRRS
jgi:hypothetical protein